MNAKKLVAGALLLFVAASVVILVAREIQQPTAGPVPTTEQLPDNALLVYYFHGDTRCPTCRTIENYSQEAVQAAFATELAENKLLWKVVNYEQPENSHFVTEYELVSPTVVLVRTAKSQVVDWRDLVRVWELVGDRDAFTAYIQSETRSMLGS